MKKYSSGNFIDAAIRVYGSEADTINSFPATIIGNGGAISPWTISGNMTVSSACGDKTANLFDKDTWSGVSAQRGTIEVVTNGFKLTATSNDAYTNTYGSANPQCSYRVVEGETYTLSWEVDDTSILGVVYILTGTTVGDTVLINTYAGQKKASFTIPSGHNYVAFRLGVSTSGESITYTNIMLNEGSTAKPYEPFGVKIPILLDSISYPIYISEPLRKTLDGSNLYDTIESNGTLTRRADSSGDALTTPTTELITVPTLTTSGTAETVNIDTTLKPSAVQLTYTGWHTHDDKKRSGGAWV